MNDADEESAQLAIRHALDVEDQYTEAVTASDTERVALVRPSRYGGRGNG